MPQKTKTSPNWLQVNTLRLARVNFYYVGAYGLSIIVYDAGKVLAPAAVLQSWTLTAVMLVVTTLIWYASRRYAKSNTYYQTLAYGLILLDIGVAAFSVYLDRGMASQAVALFAIPIAASSILRSRSALLATAALCTAAYAFAAIRYFVVNFNEGYKIELYNVIGFYSACFFVLAAILWVVLRSPNSDRRP